MESLLGNSWIYFPEGTKRATPINVQRLRLQQDLPTGSLSRDIVNFPSEFCSRRSGMLPAVARLVPPDCLRIISLWVGRAAITPDFRGFDSGRFSILRGGVYLVPPTGSIH